MNANNISEKDFERVFREYHSRLYYFALNYLEDEGIAEDIVSDVFAATWSNRGNITREKLVGYLYSGVRNRCINSIKRSGRNIALDDAYSALSEMPSENGEYWQQREERISMIEEEIAKLPERTRIILRECYYNHMTYREVAEEIGISTEGIKKQLVRAMAHLRDIFNNNKQ